MAIKNQLLDALARNVTNFYTNNFYKLLVIQIIMLIVIVLLLGAMVFYKPFASNMVSDPVYPVSLQIFNSAGISNDNAVYLGDHVTISNWDDLRFYDNNGTFLSYNIKNNYTDHVEVIVNATEEPDAGTMFTLAYGSNSFLLICNSQSQLLFLDENRPNLLRRTNISLTAAYPQVINNIGEPTVIYDTDPLIFTNLTWVFKIWYECGFNSDSYLFYAESPNGIDWYAYSDNPLDNLYYNYREFTLRNPYDKRFYMYVQPICVPDRYDRYSSPDGVNWTLDQFGVLAGGQGWDNATFGNVNVWLESANSWMMLYEAKEGIIWKIGLATSSDGLSWVKYDKNPVINHTYSTGGPEVHKIGNQYYLFLHRSPNRALPTDIYLYKSTNLISWSLFNVNRHPLIARISEEEGAYNMFGQVGDATAVEVNGATYIYFTATSDGRSAYNNSILKLATANMTLEQLIDETYS